MFRCDICGRERESQTNWFKMVNLNQKVTKTMCPSCGQSMGEFLDGIKEPYEIELGDVQTLVIGRQ